MINFRLSMHFRRLNSRAVRRKIFCIKASSICLMLLFGCSSLNIKYNQAYLIRPNSTLGTVGFDYPGASKLSIKMWHGNDYIGYQGMSVWLEYSYGTCPSRYVNGIFNRPDYCLKYTYDCSDQLPKMCIKMLDLTEAEEKLLRRGEEDASAIDEFLQSYNKRSNNLFNP